MILAGVFLLAVAVARPAYPLGGLLKKPEIAMKDPERMKSVMRVLTDKKYRFAGGIFINAHTTLFYSGDTGSLNLFLDALAKVENTSVQVKFSKEASGTTLSLGDRTLETGPSQWRVSHNAWVDERQFQVTVFLGDGTIDLEKVYLPETNPRKGAAAAGPNAWSDPVNGLQARLALSSRETVNGTPLLNAYLELRNVSDVANTMQIPLDRDQVKFTVTDSRGQPKQPHHGPYDGVVVPFAALCLPHEGFLRFNIACRGLGIPKDQGALLDLGAGSSWVFARDDREAYSLHAEWTIAPTGKKDWSGTIETPKVLIPVELLPEGERD